MTRFLSPTFASSTRTSAENSDAWTSKSPRVITAPRDLPRKPKLDSISSPGSKTMPSCAAFSILRKSPRGSLPYEHPTHFYRGPYALWLHRGGGPFSLPGGHAFRLLHLPAVPEVHPGQARQAQHYLCPKSHRKEARQLQGIPAEWACVPPFLAESLRSHWQGQCPFSPSALDRIHPHTAHCLRLHSQEPGLHLPRVRGAEAALLLRPSWNRQKNPPRQALFRGHQGHVHRPLFRR